MGETISATTAFIRQNHKILLKAIFFLALPFILLGLISYTFTLAVLLEDFWDDYDSSAFATYSELSSIFSIFSLLGSIVLVAVVYEYIILYFKRSDFEQITVREIGKRVLDNIGLYLSTTILLFFVVLALLVPFTALMFAWFSLIIGMTSGIAVFVVITTVGILLMCSYPVITLSFIYIVRLVEGKSFGAALSRCMIIVQGKWFSTLWLYMITVFIVMSLIGLVPAILTGLTAFLINIFSWESMLFLLPVTGVVYTIVGVIVNVITLIVVALRYFSIVEEKEGIGLMRKIALIGEERE
ncbi:MAG: hypothetical protein IPM47_16945 [Sphingobacteriales bacterium]|nr:MAG: hypothetical protein IPM47_16945 [Sphingobacteriales bacterium]